MVSLVMIEPLSDAEALRDIIVRTAKALDTKKFTEWLDLCDDEIELVFPQDAGNPIVVCGKNALSNYLRVLDQFEATTHFTGNSIIEFTDSGAMVETYCVAHHIKIFREERVDLKMSIRYLDGFKKTDRWLMTRRELVVVWHAVQPAPFVPLADLFA